jgi:PAS domain S-box-containing protein
MTNRLYHLWLKFTEPLSPLSSPQEEKHNRVVASFSMSVLLVAYASVLYVRFFYTAEQITRILPILFTLMLYVIPYLVARTGKTQMAIVAHTLITSLNTFLGAALLRGDLGISILYFVILVCVYAATFLSIKEAAMITAANLLVMVLIIPSAMGYPLEALLTGPVFFNVISAGFVLLIITYWRGREAAQREESKRSEARYRFISEMTSDYMFLVRCDSTQVRELEWITESVKQVTGYLPEDALSVSTDTIYPLDYERVMADRARVLAGETVEAEYRFRRRDGAVRWIFMQRRPAYDDQGNINGYYGAVRDITDQKDAEAKQMQLSLRREQFHLVERFLAAMSHDFRNRLASIEASRYLIQRITERAADATLPEKLMPRMQTIQQSINEIMAQLDSLSVVSSLSSAQYEALDVCVLLSNLHTSLSPLVAEKGLRLDVQCAEELPVLYADTKQINGALHHLLTNAIRYSEEGDSVTVRACRREGSMAIEVEDEGKGIALEDQAHIFEPFFKVGDARTTSEGGIGLGLTIVKLIVEMHGGTIEVDSAPGRGSLFRVLFPLTEPIQ